MDLTARYVEDSRRVIGEAEAADITNPDLPRQAVTVLMVRLTETLRTMSDHAERLATSADSLRTVNAGLEAENRRLRQKLADLQTETAA
ncbi:hypothetical protein ACF061_00865 [Streptomyces sp. NPDC015220]|uniref:hypothetical protein n=1 Tax=Streptomyces sp. NPDC015220 TaxID=3364947 RepID=UPI0036F9E601